MTVNERHILNRLESRTSVMDHVIVILLSNMDPGLSGQNYIFLSQNS